MMCCHVRPEGAWFRQIEREKEREREREREREMPWSPEGLPAAVSGSKSEGEAQDVGLG
jgi:hypothetical protein